MMRGAVRHITICFALTMAGVAEAQRQPDDPRNLVVMIRAQCAGSPSFGAGIVVDESEDGKRKMIATAAHVVSCEDPRTRASLQIKLRRTGEQVYEYNAERIRVVRAEREGLDLALVELNNDDRISLLSERQRAVLLPANLKTVPGVKATFVGNKSGSAWHEAGGDNTILSVDANEIIVRSKTGGPGLSGGAVIDELGALIAMTIRQEGEFFTTYPIARVARELKGWGQRVSLRESSGFHDRRSQLALSRRGIPASIDGVVAALEAADVGILQSLAEQVDAQTFSSALRTKSRTAKSSVAEQFFRASASQEKALKPWLQEVLMSARRGQGAGVDPNLTVPGDYYTEEALLISAIRSKNYWAAETLLESGASPHGYQTLHLTRYARTRFLFPFQYLAEDEAMTLDQRARLSRALLAAGGVVPRPVREVGVTRTAVMGEAEKLSKELAPKLGVPIAVTPTLCQKPNSPICENASKLYGGNWCDIVSRIPKRLNFSGAQGTTSPIYDITILHLLSIYDDKIYLLALGESLGIDYVLVESARDGSSMNVYRHMSPAAAMGLCRKEDDYQPDNCWRRAELLYREDKGVYEMPDWGLEWFPSMKGCAEARQQ